MRALVLNIMLKNQYRAVITKVYRSPDTDVQEFLDILINIDSSSYDYRIFTGDINITS